jgi:hypothetical protein
MAFSWVHPDIGVRLAQYLSVKNKLISGDEDITFLGGQGMADSVFEEKTGNQTLQLPFWTPSSTYESFCW